MCGLDAALCRKALEESNGDLDTALARLIDFGQVKYDDLDPDTVADELFGRAYQHHLDALFTELPEPSGPLASGFPPGFHDVLRQFITRAAEVRRTGPGQTLTESSAAAKHNVRTKPPGGPGAGPRRPSPAAAAEGHLEAHALGRRGRAQDLVRLRPERGSKGKFALSIPRPPDDDDSDPTKPAAEMVAAYTHLKEHEKAVTAAVLDAFRSHIDDALIRSTSGTSSRWGTPRAMKRMELSLLTLLPVAKDGWRTSACSSTARDPEHNAGALLHGSRVVKVGDNETAVDTFAAEEDGGEEIRYPKRRPST